MAAVFTDRIRVLAHECDFMGHVNNATYVRYLCQASLDAWTSPQPTTPPVRHLAIEYHAPAGYGDVLTVTARGVSSDERTLLMGYTLNREPDGALKPYAASGEWRGPGPLPLVESLASGALQESSGEPVVAHLQTQDPNTISVLCAPMLADAGPLGVIVLGSRRREAFVRQHTRLVSAIAGQTALLVENTRLYARLEHQAILAERGRLAREMHDGLAQTLGYLKLRAGQIARWLESGQLERAGSGRALRRRCGGCHLRRGFHGGWLRRSRRRGRRRRRPGQRGTGQRSAQRWRRHHAQRRKRRRCGVRRRRLRPAVVELVVG